MKPIFLPASTRKTLHRSLFAILFSCASAAQAGWTPTAAGTYDYNDTANWSAATVNGVFDTPAAGAQVIEFGADTTLAAVSTYSLNIGNLTTYGASSPLTFQSNSGTARVLTLSGNIFFGAAATQSNVLNLGVTGNTNPLTLSVTAARFIEANGIRNGTINVNAFITGAGSLSVSKLASGGVINFNNNLNDFTGDWSLAQGKVQFTSLADSGTASSLGKGSAISFGSATSATLLYTGAATSSNRTINVSGNQGNYLTNSTTAGKLTLTGNIQGTTGAARDLRIAPVGSTQIEISGTISNPVSGGDLSIMKYSNIAQSLGTLTISGTNNSYAGTTTNVAGVLEFASVKNVGGGNSSLGAVTTVANGTIGLGLDGVGVTFNLPATLRYIGSTNSTTDRVLNLGSTTAASTLDASGAGTITFTSATTATGAGSKTLTLTGSNTGSNSLGAVVDNSGTNKTSVTKTGVGKWVLSGTNSYTGSTLVSAGTLVIDGSLNAASAVTVANGGTVGGSGNIQGTLTVQSGGTVNAGNSPGTLSSGTFNLNSGGAFVMDLASASSYDQLNVTGGVTLAGNLTLNLGYTPLYGAKFFLLLNDGADAVSGTFAGLAQNATFFAGPQEFKISYLGDSATNSLIGGNDVVLQAIPEPSVANLILAGVGISGFVVLLRRRSFPERC